MSPTAHAASASSARLLVVDDEPDLRTLYELTLVREGYDVESAGSVDEAWLRLQEQGPGHYQLVITDMRLPDGNGLDLLRRLDNAGRSEKAIVITAYGSPENAVEALKAGAYDYLTKPVDLRQFRAVVASALGRVPMPAVPARAAAPAPASAASVAAGGVTVLHPALRRIVGAAPSIQQVRGLVERVAQSMAPVLVCGESGTGKELVARAVHEVSPRGALPFVAVNCGAIPENLLEAEFFGYRKGAFTGANEDRDGFFQAAQGGTLFLDEIGDLPLPMQSKLLRVIQERAVRPLGATAETPVNVRIVSATHKDLAAEVQAGRFRQDLFYRLNVIRITMPPLRERLDDLPALCGSVLQRIARDAGVSPVPTLAHEALQHLARYGFPGNVRELENLLHRALALADGARIERADLGLPEAVLGEAGDMEANTVPAPLLPLPAPTTPPAGSATLPTDLAVYLDSIERDILERALERHRYNRTAAGASLGLSLRQMRYRMARLGVGAADSDAD
ncbi:Fis family transcriptional regulator [beta proteobacterium AAP121]|nr:Fis family transcriptional regulator [beta proteobacterium AAP65]KPF99542.1 Fis family transcriptional regulator [beta proteobacterium AAP121]